MPVSEALIDADTISRFRKGYVARRSARPATTRSMRRRQRGRPPRRHGALAAAVLRAAGDRVRLPARRRGPDRASTTWPREARDERLALIDDAFPARDEAAKAARLVLPRRCRPKTLYLPRAEWDDDVGLRDAAASSPVPARTAPGVVDMGARLGRDLRRRTGPGQRQPVRGGRRARQARWARPASACCSPPGPRARPTRLATMLADHGLTGVSLAAA